MEEGHIASFFFKDLGLALASKMCPDQSQALNEVDNGQAFTAGRKNISIFPNEPLTGAPRHVCTKIRVNVRRAYCVGPI